MPSPVQLLPRSLLLPVQLLPVQLLPRSPLPPPMQLLPRSRRAQDWPLESGQPGCWAAPSPQGFVIPLDSHLPAPRPRRQEQPIVHAS